MGLRRGTKGDFFLDHTPRNRLYRNSMKARIKNLFLLPTLIAGLGLILSCCAAKAQNNGMQYQLPSAEYNALVDLYNSTGGGAWTTSTGWLNGQATNWFNVVVAGVQYDTNGNVVVQGHVTSIELGTNELSGSLPSSLGNLSQLRYLDLKTNQLSGDVPDFIGFHCNIDISYNGLTIAGGSQSLSNINAMIAAGNNIQYTPQWMQSQIPASEYAALVDLYNSTHGTSWSFYPGYYPGWPNPHAFSWSQVVVTGGRVTALWFGNAGSGFNLSGPIPSSLGNLTQLQYLELDGNPLSGSIPDSMGNLTSLLALSLAGSQLSGPIPSSFGNLTKLQTLYVSGTPLSGPIPSSLGNLTNLQSLVLVGNPLSGSIPDSLGNLTSLQGLGLERNLLSGTIPSSLGNLTKLQTLNMIANQLSGSIPDSLGNLTSLQGLALQNNQLSGSIPSTLGNLANLQSLELEGNQLSGTIPSSLGNLANLQWLQLDTNQLSGTIASSLGNLASLQYLRLDNNQLSGTIPASLGNLANLQDLHLENNQLSGIIPASIGNMIMINLSLLYLRTNCLTYDPGSANLLLMEAITQKLGYSHAPSYGGLSSACANVVTITGHVYCTCDGSPIAGASVQIGSYSATSDGGGSYSIPYVQGGTYPASINKPNYVTTNTTITIPSGSSTLTHDFTLSPLPALDYFGVGVNWKNVPPDPDPRKNMNNVRGDLDAADLYYSLQTDLSSIFKQGTTVPLDATASSADNLNIIDAEFNVFLGGVCPNDTVVFYVSSHGNTYASQYSLPGVQLLVSADYATHSGLTTTFIANILDSLPSSTRKVVILDACHSGGIASLLADSVANISILASCSAYMLTIAGITSGGTTPSESDGTGVFTDALIAELDMGIVDLNRIVNDINDDHLGIYASLIGQDLYLRDSGSAVFTGLQPQLYEGLGFTGNLASNVVSFVQPPPKVLQPTINNGSFQMTLTNVPTQGAIAIELSTNLTSWLQVAFNPAAGTNIYFSLPTTNYSVAFFRAKAVQ